MKDISSSDSPVGAARVNRTLCVSLDCGDEYNLYHTKIIVQQEFEYDTRKSIEHGNDGCLTCNGQPLCGLMAWQCQPHQENTHHQCGNEIGCLMAGHPPAKRALWPGFDAPFDHRTMRSCAKRWPHRTQPKRDAHYVWRLLPSLSYDTGNSRTTPSHRVLPWQKTGRCTTSS